MILGYVPTIIEGGVFDPNGAYIGEVDGLGIITLTTGERIPFESIPIPLQILYVDPLKTPIFNQPPEES